MKKFFRKEVIIALVVIVSAAMLYWGINYLKGINLLTPTNYYTATYTKINGLTLSAPVTINGFQVGLVTDITYDYENNEGLIVELSLDEKLKLPVGTEAYIVTDMLGTSTVAIELAQGVTEYYSVGAEIPGKLQAGLMDDLSNQILPSVAEMLPKLDSILVNINTVLSNPAINESVTRLNSITYNLERLSSELNTVVSSDVKSVMSNADEVVANLRVVSTNLADITTELNDSTINNVNSVVSNLKLVTDKMNSEDSSIGLLLNDNRVYNHADQTILSLDSLLKDIKANPKRYINVKVF